MRIIAHLLILRAVVASTEDSLLHAQALAEWFAKSAQASVEDGGSFLHSGLEIRPRSSEDPRLGVFAKASIDDGALLLSLPRSLILTPSPPLVGDRVEAHSPEGEEEEEPRFGVVQSISDADGTYTIQLEDGQIVSSLNAVDVRHDDAGGVNCGSVRRVLHEFELGDQSVWGPYLRFMQSVSASGRVPGAWSPAGQARLREILGKSDANANSNTTTADADNATVSDPHELLPPLGSMDLVSEHWVKACQGSASDSAESDAFHTTLQRAWGDRFVPILDLIGHRNGRHTNAVHNRIFHDDPVQLYASRALQAGEEVLISYNLCEDCGHRHLDYGTPELFRDYGFVEDYPQRWIFYFPDRTPVVFDVEQDDDKHVEWLVRWSSQHFRFPTEPADMAFFQEQSRRLEELVQQGGKLTERDVNIPDHEWKLLQQYHQSLLVAVQQAAESIRVSVETGHFEVMDELEEHEEEHHEEEEEHEYHSGDFEEEEEHDRWSEDEEEYYEDEEL